ncbi:hypothetical protein WICMUC_001042 [Wickerhamomyces mucosus]|uniref:Eukaryotic translation initiation factor 3 subunit D n=1 Tax=Wickerhamomyces mucosus TaxID=1378264 RepID=A0A9P8PW09_9ASCO|nr:hypothetical protein WICMUC_001042 [Wickerhamomyces mucosus]
MSTPFDLNSLISSSNIWGPPQAVPQNLRFSDIPYAPFSKGDKIGKAADWESKDNFSKDSKDKNRKGQRDYFHAYGASAASSFAAEENDEGDDFEVVDNSKSQPKTQQPTTLLRNKRSQPGNNNGTYQKRNVNSGNSSNTNAPTNKPQQKPFVRRPNGPSGWKDNKQERVREASIKVEDDWKIISDIEFTKLTKLNFEVKGGEDLDTYGAINPYNKKIERSSNIPLKIVDTAIYNPTASDDPIIQEFHSKNTAKVYATDSVLTQLMCASRSVYSWDIVVTKKNGVIFFDKRESSSIDKLTVEENSQDAPSDSIDSNINNAANLSLEATYINQNFLANSINEESQIKFAHPNPFANDSNETLASKGYKYRKFTLKTSEEEEDPLSIVVRTEFDSKDITTNQLLLVKAVNEYTKTGLDWKTKFNSQRGAIIAAELKNNNNKFAKWANQAVLAGVDTIKLGFVSRVNFKDNTKHQILGVSTYTPKDLALQINLSTGNGWGIVKSYIDIISHEDDGKFIILKNPNAPKLTLYKVPETSFQD